MNDNTEVNGQTILSILNGLGVARTLGNRILADNSILDPQPNHWYPAQSFLDAFKLIKEKIGTATLFKIGKEIIDSADFPPNISDIFSGLASIDIAYHMNHRINGTVLFNPETGQMLEGIGNYLYTKHSDNIITIACDNPYPCDFDKGIITAMANRFRPENSLDIKIEHNDSEGCRKKGDKKCVYTISW